MVTVAPSLDRIVRRGRLRVPGPDALAGFRFLIEDALNTASLPSMRGLVVVRRLSLGRLPYGSGRLACARRTEAALKRVLDGAAHGAAPGADDAEAVWFRDAEEAALALLARLAEGRAADAWYWPGALPGLPSLPAGGLAAHLVARLLSKPAGLHSLGRFLAGSPESGVRRLLDLLPPTPPSELVERLPPLTPGEELGSPRSQPHRLPEVPDRPNDPVLDLPVTRRVPLAHAISARDWRVRLIAAAAAKAAHVGRPSAGLEASPSDDIQDRAATLGDMRLPTAERSSSFMPERRPTRRGGLLMLVNLLDALGFPDWLGRQPPDAQAPFVRTLLRLLGRLPPHDPHRALLGLSPIQRRTLGEVWCDADFLLPSWCPVALPPGPLRAREALHGWRRIVHAACRHGPGVTAPLIIRRDAQLSLGLTHADVIFSLAEADVRLRRAGLDQDPGWAPWLGYVVSFHFVEKAG